MATLKVNEIFRSLQGEGPDACKPATFLRLQGCNLRCSWCDTKDSLSEGALIYEVGSLVEELSAYGLDFLVLTGGEPLIQSDALALLIQLLWERSKGNIRIAIQTNGTLPIPFWWLKAIWDIDRKCPSSGMSGMFNSEWCSLGRERSRLKFVVQDDEDLDYVTKALREPELKHKKAPEIILSPVILFEHDRLWSQKVWAYCVKNNLRMSLQAHKIVFGNKRGV